MPKVLRQSQGTTTVAVVLQRFRYEDAVSEPPGAPKPSVLLSLRVCYTG